MVEVEQAYTGEQFRLLIEQETETVELKTGTGAKPLQDAMVALSNTRGGVIFIGVTDARDVRGRRLDQGTADAVHEAARSAHDLGRYTLRAVSVEGVAVTAVLVEKRQQGFSATSDGRVLVRRGASKSALVGYELFEFVTARALRRFEQVSSALLLTGADPSALQELTRAYGWMEGTDISPRLQERGLVDGSGHLTYAGALCLTDPAKSLDTGKFVIEVLRYGADEGQAYDRREVFTGPVFEQVRSAAAFVSAELGTDLVVTGLYRQELPRLPPRVVREAIANAVAHRSYELDRTTIQVQMRPSRVVVTSPGRLVEPVTVESLRYAQAARNQDVISVLRQFDLAEDNGQGIDVMQDEMSHALLDAPEFVETTSSVVVTLNLLGPIAPRERAWVDALLREGSLQAADRLCLVVAARGTALTNSTVREVTGLDSTEARRSLQRLRDAGLLEQHGERGGVSYTLVPAFAPAAAYRMTPKQLEDLVLAAASEHSLTNGEVRTLTGLDRAESRALLARLVERGVLLQEGRTRATSYRRA